MSNKNKIEDGFYRVTRDGLTREVEVKDGWIWFCTDFGKCSLPIDDQFTNWKKIAPFELC